ncbi:MAG: hypothetical protein AAFQ13_08565 [Pseudomonadota bacterium]
MALIGCAPAGEAEDSASESVAAKDEAERPDEAPTIGASDDLLALSCADFIAAAAVATNEEDEEAALLAQDEIAAGLVWVHGYLYAKRDGEISVLSQDWLKDTAERIYATCTAAEDPTQLNLFEVASNESA